MSTLGKVLAIFNVLAAIGFLALSAMDYSKRQNWAYAHFRHQIAIDGLPVDQADEVGLNPGDPFSRRLSPEVLKQLYGGTAGPATQVDEVKNVLATFNQQLEAAADVKAKRDVLARYLLPLQTRGDAREQLIRELQGVKDAAGVEKLKLQFEKAARRLIDPKVVAAEDKNLGGINERDARRRAIADFLYNIDPSAAWHNRVQTVVGLTQYVGAGERQYAHLRDMSMRLKTVIANEETAFVDQYTAAVRHLPQLADRLKRLELDLAEQQGLVQKHTAQRNARKSEVDDLDARLKAARLKAQEETMALEAVQKELFAVQQACSKALAENQQMENEIRSRERGR